MKEKKLVKFEDLPQDLVHQLVYYSFRGNKVENLTRNKIMRNCKIRLDDKDIDGPKREEIMDSYNILKSMSYSEIIEIYNEYDWEYKFNYVGNSRDEDDEPYDLSTSEIIFRKAGSSLPYYFCCIDGYDVSIYNTHVLNWKYYEGRYFVLLNIIDINNQAIDPSYNLYFELILGDEILVRVRDAKLIDELEKLPTSVVGNVRHYGIDNFQ